MSEEILKKKLLDLNTKYNGLVKEMNKVIEAFNEWREGLIEADALLCFLDDILPSDKYIRLTYFRN